MSPSKRAPQGVGTGQMKPGASDLSMAAADGPRGSLGVNSENSLFNKHYNKELKLCEGKFREVKLIREEFLYLFSYR